MKFFYSFFTGFYFLPIILSAQNIPVKQVRLSNFFLQSSEVISASGPELSKASYSYKDYWFPVRVPSTVLSGLVQNKLYPDPYIGMNNMYIPDASDSFNNEYHLGKYSHIPNEPNPWKKPYWYLTKFSVPASDRGRHFQLIFKGINYRAEVWLNGKMIIDSSRMAGMFAQYYLDVSSSIEPGSENALAVKIFPLDYPGLPAHPQTEALGDFYDNGGPTGDIGKNVTMLSSVGWDWIPEVRDRNMGIWQPVYLRTSGQVVISSPHIITDLPSLPDTSQAKISLNLLLSNYSKSEQDGKLKITISPENFQGSSTTFMKDVPVGGLNSTRIYLSALNTPAFNINHPHLWWPNGHGYPSLYRMRIQYLVGNQLYDDTSVVFGIRTVSSSTIND